MGAGRHDHFQPRNVGKERLHALGVVQASSDAAAIRRPNDHGNRIVAIGAVIHPRCLAHQLVEGGEYEVGELNLYHRAHPVQGRADGHSHQARFGQRRVDDPVYAEFGL